MTKQEQCQLYLVSLVVGVFMFLQPMAVAFFSFDFFVFILALDPTFISITIVTAVIVLSLVNTKETFAGNPISEWNIFVTENMVTLGMFGTLIGMIMALISLFGLDLTDHHQAAQGISSLAVGVGAAVVTTLVGLASSMFLKLQLLIHEESLKMTDEDYYELFSDTPI